VVISSAGKVVPGSHNEEVGWAPETVWTFGEESNLLAHTRYRTSSPRSSSLRCPDSVLHS
jgi:hypothetical protein